MIMQKYVIRIRKCVSVALIRTVYDGISKIRPSVLRDQSIIDYYRGSHPYEKSREATDTFRSSLSPPPPWHLRTLYRYIGLFELKFAALSLL